MFTAKDALVQRHVVLQLYEVQFFYNLQLFLPCSWIAVKINLLHGVKFLLKILLSFNSSRNSSLLLEADGSMPY
jgi:hypothetical protein